MVGDLSKLEHRYMFNRTQGSVALLLLVSSGVAIALSGPALAQTRIQQQLQQRQGTTAPAPSEMDFQQPGVLPPPNSGTMPIPPSQVTPLPAVPLSGPGSPGVPLSGDRYVVYVNSSSDSTLSQVRQYELGAFKRSLGGTTVIQAGLFSDLARAQQRTTELQGFGVPAQIATIPADSTLLPPSTATPSAAPLSAPTVPPQVQSNAAGYMQARSNAYFVVVPGRTQELDAIAQQILRLGADQSAVFERVTPLGPHVAIGPFTERGSAENWSTFLRDFGLDARVFFGR